MFMPQTSVSQGRRPLPMIVGITRVLVALIVASVALISCNLSTAQSASALFLNQNPAPTNTAPGLAIFSGNAGQAGGAGTPTDRTIWLVGSAFGQPVGSDIF